MEIVCCVRLPATELQNRRDHSNWYGVVTPVTDMSSDIIFPYGDPDNIAMFEQWAGENGVEYKII